MKTTKRIISTILVVVMCLTMAPLNGFMEIKWEGFDFPEFDFSEIFTPEAKAATSGYYTYSVTDGKATITDVSTSISGNITIPSTIGGYPVTSIGEHAFEYCSALTSVSIPDSVTSIGSYAFRDCGSLQSVTIPDSVTSIGECAFGDCRSLQSVTIPDSVTSIGNYTFFYCRSLQSVTIPDSVTSIGSYAFYECSSLTRVSIGNSVTTIGHFAFSFCDNLTSVTIPDSVTSIGERAFRVCNSLTSVTIPDSVTSIGYSAFEGCDKLTDVYYSGTQKQWQKISIGSDNSNLINATIHYYNGTPIQSVYPDEYNSAINKYPDFKRLTTSFSAVPGLKETIVTDADKNICYSCNCMTPQGVCFAGDYLLISAYCSVETYKDNLTANILSGNNSEKLSAEKNHSTHNSVIYVIDKNNKILLTTLTLPDKNHVGGLAFDGSNVWVAKSSDKKVSALSLSDIQASVNTGEEGVAINYKNTFSCDHTASFVEYFDNKLWVGVFNEEKSSYMYGFTLNGDKENVSSLTEVASVAIPAKANGASFYSNDGNVGLIVNSSYGRKNDSVISLYDIKSSLNQKNINANLMTSYTFPTLAEEVVVDGDNIYMVFESATTTYCNVDGNKASSVVDRICKGNAIDFFSWMKTPEKVASTTYKNVTATLDSSYFEKDSITYNHELGRFCSLFTVIGYEYDRPDIIKQNLENCGFIVNSDYIVTDAGRDQVNHFITHKKIYADGKWQNLVFAGFIGSHEQQWYSNFDPEIGSTHLGFTNAKNYVLPRITKYIKDNGFEKSDTKILLTGHSRGAATCNLVAAQLIASEEFASKENIYAYAFATPRISKADYVKDAKYNRIFNIINPEDFVTKLLPGGWGFTRFGTTPTYESVAVNVRTLPSKTNTKASNYKKYLENMRVYYNKLSPDMPYLPYKDGEKTVHDLVWDFRNEIRNLDEYYNKSIWTSAINRMTPYAFFQNVLCPIVAFDYSKAVAFTVPNALYSMTLSKHDNLYRKLLNFFIDSEALGLIVNGYETITKTDVPDITTRYFLTAHCAETYCAYMYALSEAEISVKREGYKGSVNCPVDVEIYDNETGELVGRIVNNVVDEEIAAKENSVVMSVEGESKEFWLPSDGDYEVKLIGNAEGTMDYTLSEIDSDIGEVKRANFFDVKIEDELTFAGDVDNINDEFTVEEHVLVCENQETLEPTEITDTETTEEYTITVSVTGEGYVTEKQTAKSGDYVMLTAAPAEEWKLIGWYENGELISTEAVIDFVAKSNRSFEVKFEHNHSYETETAEANCTKDGLITYTCACGDTYTEDIPKLGHNFSKDFTIDKKATYTEAGAKSKHCLRSGCNAKSEVTAIPKLISVFKDNDAAKVSGKNIVTVAGVTVKQLLVQAGKDAVIKDSKGNVIAADNSPVTGMTLTMADGKQYTIVVFGDADGDGKVSAADARLALRASVGLENYKEDSAQYKAANVGSEDKLSAADARLILRASVGLEDPKSWMK